MKKEIEELQNKKDLLELRREAILKVLEFNDSIKNVNETYLKPIILALHFNNSVPMFLTKLDAEIYNTDIQVMRNKIVKLNKDCTFWLKDR